MRTTEVNGFIAIHTKAIARHFGRKTQVLNGSVGRLLVQLNELDIRRKQAVNIVADKEGYWLNRAACLLICKDIQVEDVGKYLDIEAAFDLHGEEALRDVSDDIVQATAGIEELSAALAQKNDAELLAVISELQSDLNGLSAGIDHLAAYLSRRQMG